MDINKLFTKRGIIFTVLFIALTYASQQINFSSLIGAPNQFFTLFQFFGPIAGAFLGPVVGILVVLVAEAVHLFFSNASVELITLLRLLPMLGAAYYFGTHKKSLNFVIPVVAILAFVIHPVGRHVWFFTLYWTIPMIVRFLPEKYADNSFVRGLGATFTAHAIGGAIWIWSIPMTAEQWIELIPVVAYERLLFAGGIGVSYLLMNTLLDKLDTSVTDGVVFVDKMKVLSAKSILNKN